MFIFVLNLYYFLISKPEHNYTVKWLFPFIFLLWDWFLYQLWYCMLKLFNVFAIYTQNCYTLCKFYVHLWFCGLCVKPSHRLYQHLLFHAFCFINIFCHLSMQMIDPRSLLCKYSNWSYLEIDVPFFYIRRVQKGNVLWTFLPKSCCILNVVFENTLLHYSEINCAWGLSVTCNPTFLQAIVSFSFCD